MQIDISSRLRRLLSLQLLHEYYGDQQAQGIQLVPTVHTQQQMSNFGLRFKTLRVSGFLGGMVMYDPDRSPELLAREEWQPEKFSFLLLNENPRFWNLTHLPFYRRGLGCYLHNLGPRHQAEGRVYLHAGERLGPELAQPVQFVPPRFVYDTGGDPVDPAHLQAEDIHGRAVELAIPEAVLAIGPQAHIPLDLSDLSPGYYRIHHGTATEQRVYTLSDALPPHLLGVVELYVSPPGGDTPSLVNPQAEAPQDILPGRSFALHFEARATFWRYVLVNSRGVNYTGFEVVNSGSGEALTFGQPEALRLADRPMSQGTEALRLVSQQAVPLREYPAQRLELSAKKKLNGKEATFKLPLPGPDRIKADAGEADTYYSDVYVYI